MERCCCLVPSYWSPRLLYSLPQSKWSLNQGLWHTSDPSDLFSIIDSFAWVFETHNYNQLSRYIKDNDLIILFGISDSYQRVQARPAWNHSFFPVNRKASPGFYQRRTLNFNRGIQVFCCCKCTLGVVDLLICVMLLSVCFQWVKCSRVFSSVHSCHQEKTRTHISSKWQQRDCFMSSRTSSSELKTAM